MKSMKCATLSHLSHTHRHTHTKMAAVAQKTPIAVLQSAWKKIAPLELADNAWDNVSSAFERPVMQSHTMHPISNAYKPILILVKCEPRSVS